MVDIPGPRAFPTPSPRPGDGGRPVDCDQVHPQPWAASVRTLSAMSRVGTGSPLRQGAVGPAPDRIAPAVPSTVRGSHGCLVDSDPESGQRPAQRVSVDEAERLGVQDVGQQVTLPVNRLPVAACSGPLIW